MIVVVDTNIVFSTILRANGSVSKVFFSIPSFAKFCAPDFLVAELQEHRAKLLKHSGLSEIEYEISKTSVFSQIDFIDVNTIPENFLKEAVRLTSAIDYKDFQFVALALFLDALLWSGDRKLTYGLRRRKFNNVITTQQLCSTFGL